MPLRYSKSQMYFYTIHILCGLLKMLACIVFVQKRPVMQSRCHSRHDNRACLLWSTTPVIIIPEQLLLQQQIYINSIVLKHLQIRLSFCKPWQDLMLLHIFHDDMNHIINIFDFFIILMLNVPFSVHTPVLFMMSNSLPLLSYRHTATFYSTYTNCWRVLPLATVSRCVSCHPHAFGVHVPSWANTSLVLNTVYKQFRDTCMRPLLYSTISMGYREIYIVIIVLCTVLQW